MSEKKTGKYLKYALGEILLVMIGILLALQVNNWNEERKERDEEKMILKNLKSEFEENLQELRIANLERKGILEASNMIFDIIDLKTYDKASTLDSLLRICMINVSFDAKRGSLDNLIFSGRLEIITNEKIRESLISWTGLINDLREEEDLIRTDAFSLNVHAFQENVSMRNIFSQQMGIKINLESNRMKELQRISKNKIPQIKPSPRQTNYSLVLSDIIFENRLTDRYRTINRALLEGIFIENITEEILLEIDSELKNFNSSK